MPLSSANSAEMATKEESVEPTFPCRICGRKFVLASLEKHEPACKKLTKMQRKVFDSGKQRATGSDIPLRDVRKAAKDREKAGGVFPRPQTNWRKNHEQFIGSLSVSKQTEKAIKAGDPLSAPPRTAGGAISADYIYCEFCGRTFSKNAAERHIGFCKEKSAQKAIKERTTTKSGRETDGKSGTKTTASHHAARTVGRDSVDSASKRKVRPESVGPKRMNGGGTKGGGESGRENAEKKTQMAQNKQNKRSISVPRNNGQTEAKSGGIVKSNFTTTKTKSINWHKGNASLCCWNCDRSLSESISGRDAGNGTAKAQAIQPFEQCPPPMALAKPNITPFLGLGLLLNSIGFRAFL
ncbi:hypothetical protein niasHT_005160 [Heterodera trifolii]|uniref:C2HC/C3H-type domain-containing protein n=1 Tax=Heterodera trifolii TaxID=157864 RepID=A0ABD2LRP9_9BILA